MEKDNEDLCDYLNRLNYDGTLSKLQEDFMDKFGVKVKNEGRYYLFKYGQIQAKWNEYLTLQCRGHILEFDETWCWRSRPFDKFFNQCEPKCPFYNEEKFNSHLEDFELIEKADGTCIQVWYDGTKWRFSTLGTITPVNVGSYGFTFTDLFENVLKKGLMDLGEYLSVENTYIFELCSEENRVVTRYPQNVIFLLGVRSIVDGNHFEESFLNNLVQILSQNGFNIRMPCKVVSKDFGNILAMIDFIEEEGKNYEKYGEFPEGFIIYWRGMPVAKMKNRHYLQLHRNMGSPVQFQEFIVDLIFEGRIDDAIGTIPVSMQDFVSFAKVEVKLIFECLVSLVVTVRENIFVNQKAYAEKVLIITPDKRFQNFLFRQKQQILIEDNSYEVIEEWLFKNRARFFDDVKKKWKEKQSKEQVSFFVDTAKLQESKKEEKESESFSSLPFQA